MNNKISDETRAHFRDWLRAWMRQEDFWSRRSDHYLVREFAKYCRQRGEELKQDLDIDEASLGRYLRDEDPVVPTTERCRMLAAVLGLNFVDVMIEAGYLTLDDLSTWFDQNAEK